MQTANRNRNRPDDGAIEGWLNQAVVEDASDLHLTPGYPPVLRIHGRMASVDDAPLEAEPLRAALQSLCTQEFIDAFLADKNADFSFDRTFDGVVRRFRANYFLSGGSWGACFRLVPGAIPTFSWAGFPLELAQRLASFRNGLVLLTGASGSGKTTTLAMIIGLLHEQGGSRIVTIEEPIEYVFSPRADSMITQREVGADVHSFAGGLRAALRQDPDVILVGEIRDRDTAQMALSASETGHLVFSTLHTRDAKGAVSRFVDFFPQNVQGEIRSQLALSLRAVISQHLIPALRLGDKRQLALEVMFNNSPIASAIRFGKSESIDNYILTGRSDGMITLDESVRRIFEAGHVSKETAKRFMADPSKIA